MHTFNKIMLLITLLLLCAGCAGTPAESPQPEADVQETPIPPQGETGEREQSPPPPTTPSQQQDEHEPPPELWPGIEARLNDGYEQAITIFSDVIEEYPAHARAYWQRA